MCIPASCGSGQDQMHTREAEPAAARARTVSLNIVLDYQNNVACMLFDCVRTVRTSEGTSLIWCLVRRSTSQLTDTAETDTFAYVCSRCATVTASDCCPVALRPLVNAFNSQTEDNGINVCITILISNKSTHGHCSTQQCNTVSAVQMQLSSYSPTRAQKIRHDTDCARTVASQQLV
jgi:hypothetical protein